MEYIECAVDSARNLTIGEHTVYEGEKNCAALKIPISFAPGAEYFMLNFSFIWENRSFSSGRITENSSPARIENGYIICPLAGLHTRGEAVAIQAQAHIFEGETETVIKTGTAILKIKPSLNGGCEGGSELPGLSAEVRNLAKRVDKIDFAIPEFTPAYFACALAAEIFADGGAATPVYFPESRSEAEALIGSLIENYDYEKFERIYAVIPSDGNSPAELVMIGSDGSGTSAARYAVTDIIALLKEALNG